MRLPGEAKAAGVGFLALRFGTVARGETFHRNATVPEGNVLAVVSPRGVYLPSSSLPPKPSGVHSDAVQDFIDEQVELQHGPCLRMSLERMDLPRAPHQAGKGNRVSSNMTASLPNHIANPEEQAQQGHHAVLPLPQLPDVLPHVLVIQEGGKLAVLRPSHHDIFAVVQKVRREVRSRGDSLGANQAFIHEVPLERGRDERLGVGEGERSRAADSPQG
eukprot:CAMPEP_0182519694 /NCGR_PEP_ID=MMETSP1321-20130603/45232_1 /TAXON_ID=91990 /ORGANISM="Bolidomonas sp., Strain RCC1657" /LENGTH=217 /DNA_ID=CAMNT_0024727679 /DNA_START=560 /DNA_END=1212 /DNA_ORIENTATION=+